MKYSFAALLAVVAPLLLVSPVSAQAPCPNPPPATISNSTPPVDVCIPQNFAQLPIQFFDDFSWRSFVALVWPAKSGQRGVPDTAKHPGDPGPLVFETYKSLAEVFHNDASAPADWNSFDSPMYNACSQQMAFGDLVLASFAKFSNIGQAGFGSLQGPLIAQNKTYVRFLTAYNEPEFKAMQSGKWYVRANIPAAGVTFANGSIDIKAAWMDMTGVNADRFYTRTAWVQDPATDSCSQKKVGLVGLHIVQKTPSRPQWIWSSFEQIDNVPEAGAQAPFNFNNGDGSAMKPTNPIPLLPIPAAPPSPYNVSRIKPIHTSTASTNASYQQALAGTPWRFYKLVTTQWPVCATPPCSPTMRGNPPNTFPGTPSPNDKSAFANTTMETFEQSSVVTGCMACHNIVQTVSGVQKGTDFLWSLRNHASAPIVPNVALEIDKESIALGKLLQKAKITPKDAKAAADLDKAAVKGR